MGKAKVIKKGLKLVALVLAGVLTVLNSKLASDEMKETVAKEVDEALKRQAKES